MGCGTERHRAYHENICVGLAEFQIETVAGPSNHGNNGDFQSEAAEADSDEPLFSEWPSNDDDSADDDSSSSSSDSTDFREHAQQLVAKAVTTFDSYGDKCTFDLADFIIRRSLGQRGGTELMQLVSKHGINGGNGLHPRCNSYAKLNGILDQDPCLPFTTHIVASDMFPDRKHTLCVRDMLACIKHLFHLEDFDGHMHVRPCRETN